MKIKTTQWFCLSVMLTSGQAWAGRATIGVDGKSVPKSKTEHIDAEGGVRVVRTITGCPADTVFLADDIITQIDGQPVNSLMSMSKAIGSITTGGTLAIVYYRATERREAEVKVAEERMGKGCVIEVDDVAESAPVTTSAVPVAAPMDNEEASAETVPDEASVPEPAVPEPTAVPAASTTEGPLPIPESTAPTVPDQPTSSASMDEPTNSSNAEEEPTAPSAPPMESEAGVMPPETPTVGPTADPAPSQPTPTSGLAGQLQRLHVLYTDGYLSEAEFKAAKQQLLDKTPN